MRSRSVLRVDERNQWSKVRRERRPRDDGPGGGLAEGRSAVFEAKPSQPPPWNYVETMNINSKVNVHPLDFLNENPSEEKP
ncbi:hypothetical protein Tco_0291093 [Tanacetum coccineum]